MNKKTFNNLTQSFEGFKPLLNEQKELKRLLSKNKRRLITLEKKYVFLKNLVGIDVKDDLLVSSIFNFFKDLGFNEIKNVDKRYRKEDLRIIFDKKLFLLEITGSEKANAKDNKTRQLTKHLEKERLNNQNVFGLTIFNHDNKKDYLEREINCFSKDQITYAKDGKYGLITTVELLNAFKKIKEGKLSIEDFKKEILKFGEVKF